MRRVAVFFAVVALLTSCSSSRPPEVAGAPTAPTTTAPPTTTTSAPTLPADCVQTTPAATALVTFVASGRAWAVDPDHPEAPTCLFAVEDSGFFSWGPQGDRVVLAGLEVRGVGSDASRPAEDVDPSYFSWSRPTGTTVVFTDQRQRTIARADVGVATTRDITPLPGVRFGDIAYHPSGLAIGFVATDAAGISSIHLATNQGTDARLLVQGSSPETKFEHIVFARDGVGLYYTIDEGSAAPHRVARYDIAQGTVTDTWDFSEPVAEIIESRTGTLAFTVGATCEARHILVQAGAGLSTLEPLDVGRSGPATLVGRLDTSDFVVKVGGCDAPADLYVVNSAGGLPRLLATSIDTAAMRTPEPTPPPPLPDRAPRSGFA